MKGTSIGRVRALGSAKEGAAHWFHHKISAGSNLLLMVWLLASIARLPSFEYKVIVEWLASPWAAIPMILLISSICYHFRHGLQVVIEDYQHDESRVVLMVLLTFFTIAVAAIAIFSILKIAFTAGIVA